jgi:head-tail adaptor
MTHRVRFERRAASTDSYGNVAGAFETLFTASARLRLRAPRGETVEAGRPEPSIVGFVTIYRSAVAEGLTAADRGVFTVGPWEGRVFNIRAIAPTEDRRFLDISFEEGAAT